jgi:hypothetical protein
MSLTASIPITHLLAVRPVTRMAASSGIHRYSTRRFYSHRLPVSYTHCYPQAPVLHSPSKRALMPFLSVSFVGAWDIVKRTTLNFLHFFYLTAYLVLCTPSHCIGIIVD